MQIYYLYTKTKSRTCWSFTFFIRSVWMLLDSLLNGGLIAISSLHLGSSIITRCLGSGAGATLTMELHQFAH